MQTADLPAGSEAAQRAGELPPRSRRPRAAAHADSRSRAGGVGTRKRDERGVEPEQEVRTEV